jgi:ferric enterobactin receptor
MMDAYFRRVTNVRRVITLAVVFFLQHFIYGQSSERFNVSGSVIDSSSLHPLASATVQLYNSQTGSLITEQVSTDKGDFRFSIPQGSYYVQLTFTGYHPYKSRLFVVQAPVDLGTLRLSALTSELEQVIVQAEKSSMQLSLDKKVFNVGQDLANAGGSALDVLSNIPSVSVDPEGQVKLRGSDNVRILIDGKPSGLVSFKGGSGLQQLQANMIERIEIITNPSARYEAEGNAGILNIILKKERKQGFNGALELILGDPTNLGAAANLNFRHKRVNFFINYSLSYRKNPGRGNLYQEVYSGDTVSILEQESESLLKGLNNNIRGGIDYFFTEKSVLTGSYLFRRSDADRIMDITYKDYLFEKTNPTRISTRRQDETEDEPNSEYSLVYKRTFNEKDHELLAEMKFLDNWESSYQLFTQHFFQPGGEPMDPSSLVQNSQNDESEKQFLVQLDYIKPIGSTGKLETGFRSSIRAMTNDYVVSEQNDAGQFIPMPDYDNVFFYDENIHAAYGILANKQKRLSYQAGLRAEWTDVKTTLEKTNEVNPRNYVNLFPTAHLSLEMAKENSVQLSYSRRVRRPFYNDLSPFFTFSDNRNYFAGNPDLNPEFSDVVELGHLKEFDKGSFSSAIYYRNTNGKIQSIRTVDEAGNSVTIPQNLDWERSIGAEFISNYTPFAWWKMDFSVNLFHSDIDGSNIVESYRTEATSWFARQTSRFSFAGNFDIQVRFNYEAPRNTVQGRQKSLYFADLSASKDLFAGKGTINLNILDVFNSRWMRSVSMGPNFYTRSESQFRRRQINVTFNYRIRQAKSTKPNVEE